ncbi:Zn-dependent protease with chaperone function, partial [Rhodococcus sp. IITR03]
LAVGGPSTVLRVQRLTGPGPHLGISAAAYTTAAAILVVPTIAVAVPWLTELSLLLGL